jgi:hypothetical protein
MSFAAIVAIDDDDAPGSLLPLLLPLLLHALVVKVVLLKLVVLRVLLVLALRGERRSCKSVRLILFPPNKPQPRVGENKARERCVFFRQRITCARAEVNH